MIAAIENTFIGEFMRAYWWAFPVAEVFHFVGLALLMGSLAVIDLRMLGFARALPVQSIHSLLRWTWIGFIINLITGVLFISAQASFYYPNTAFWVKMVLILLAGINALLFQLTVQRELAGGSEAVLDSGRTRFIATSSLVLWIAVIFFGRFIMYWPPI